MSKTTHEDRAGSAIGALIALTVFSIVGLALYLGVMEGAQSIQPSANGVAVAIQDGRATVSAGMEMMRATERAQEERRAKATLRAAQTQGAAKLEIELLGARIEATQVAMELSFAQADATQAAGMQSTQAAGTATWQAAVAMVETQAAAPSATIAAIQAETEIDLARRQKFLAQAGLYFWPVFWLLILIGLIILIVLGAVVLFRWFLKWRTLAESVRTPEGRLVWDVDGQLPSLVTSQRVLPLYRGDNEVKKLTPGGSVLSAPIQRQLGRKPSGNYAAAKFLEQAISVAGEESRVLPGWRSMPGMSSSSWQAAVAALATAGLVVPRVGVATYVADDFQDLGDVLEKVERRSIQVPYPTPGGAGGDD